MKISWQSDQRKHLSESWLEDFKHVLNDKGEINLSIFEKLEKEMKIYLNITNLYFEKSFASALGTVLRVFEVNSNDYVILPSLAPSVLLGPVMDCKAKIIFCPVHEKTFTLDIISLQEILNNLQNVKTEDQNQVNSIYILALDTFSLPADYPALEKIAQKFQAVLVDIAIHGIGGNIRGTQIPSFGDLGIINFDMNSSISSLDNCAAVTLNNKAYQYKLNDYYKFRQKYFETDSNIYNFNIFNAQIISRRLEIFISSEQDRLNEIRNFYTTALFNVTDVPFLPVGFESGNQSYCLKLANKTTTDKLKVAFDKNQLKTVDNDLRYLPEILEPSEKDNYLNHDIKQRLKSNKVLLSKMFLLPLNPYNEIAKLRKIIDVIKQNI